MNFDGIIFDIDGTIWDIRDVVADAWSEAIKDNTKLEVSFDAESLGKLFGKPMNEIFKTLYPNESNETMERLIPYLYEYEHRFIRERKPVAYKGIEETLEKLSKKFDLYIVTNAQKQYTEEMLGATNLEKYFKDWMCYGDTLKPKNVTLEMLIEKNGIKNPVYIGDTQGDYEACEKAKVPFIYANYGLGEVKEYSVKIDDISELCDTIDKMIENM